MCPDKEIIFHILGLGVTYDYAATTIVCGIAYIIGYLNGWLTQTRKTC